MVTSIPKTGGDRIDISVLGRRLNALMDETLGVEKMQKRINLLKFTRERFDGTSLVMKLAEKISGKIIQHVDGLRKTKHILHNEIASGTYQKSSCPKWESCCRYPHAKMVFDKSFKTKVDTSSLCELVSDSTPLKYYQLPETVLDQMRRNHQDMPSLKWQYIGSNEGVFFSYPAHRTEELCFGLRYDPRHRPWYVEAARPERKDVLILLDSSNSMARTHNSIRLIDIARDAIDTLLDSFMPDDKIGIVAFNDTAFYPNNCFSKQLGYANSVNKRKLKENFLSRLHPAGQSHYVEAFKAAFKIFDGSKPSKVLLEARPTLHEKRHCVILFISDGDASEIHHDRVQDIAEVIKRGNHNLLNRVTMFTYGLGREANLTLLQKIAAQDFDEGIVLDNITSLNRRRTRNITRGRAYRINEPSQLRNALSFFYTGLLGNTTRRELEPSFSVPYVDTGGLGLIFTAGFPVFGYDSKGDFMAAVVAIDISIADLLGDLIKLKNDDRSYVFVIDGSGRVLIHPLMPVPDGANGPSYIHVEALERDPSLKVVIKSMIEGKRGSKTVLSSRVAPAGDCNQVFVVNQTYHWYPIANTNFSLCFVEEETDYIVSLPPHLAIYACVAKNGSNLVARQCPNVTMTKFRYHRLDLTESSDICRHFYQMSMVKSSVVKLAPQCFVDPSLYERRSETVERVRDYESFFNDLLAVSTSEEAKKILETESVLKGSCNEIREDVVSDILWTAFSDTLWLGNNENHVVRRFIGTRNGMTRIYPGTNMSTSYDPIKRDWYELALAFPGRIVFSPPYKDAAGAGNIITVSHTVHTPQIEGNDKNEGLSEEKIIGVMGLDLSLTSFYASLIELYPQCNNKWNCFIVDIRGYVVLHKDYTESEKPERKHLTGEEGPLSQILLKRGLMYRTRCLELQTSKYKVSYVINDGAYLNELENGDRCKRYYMKAIPNSNVFLIAREFHSPCYYETCLINKKHCKEHDECLNHDDWSNATCECPCRSDLVVNSCESFVDAQMDIVACYPFRETSDAVKNNCIPEGLPPCYDPHCDEKATNLNCSSVVGCSWCQKSYSGRPLEKPFCAETEQCYDGSEGQKLPGFAAERKICKLSSAKMNQEVFLIAAVSGGLVVLIAILVVYICRSKHSRASDKTKSLEYESSRRSSYSNIDQDVATIAAAIGAREQLSRRQGISAYFSTFAGRQEEGRGGSSVSSISNTRQKSLASPQVVLSIVDGDGAEIARSLPRPVQIVRGNRIANVEGGKTSSRKPECQLQSSSTASIVIGSAGNCSNVSSSSECNAELTSFGSHHKQKVGRCNSEDLVERIFPRSHSSRPNHTVTSCGTSIESFGERCIQSCKEEYRTQSISISKVFRSVLKKRIATKDTTSCGALRKPRAVRVASCDVDLDAAFSDMFAEPNGNECDIPVIQSDHSDSESMSEGGGGARDYVSMEHEPGQISINGRFASKRQSDAWRKTRDSSGFENDDGENGHSHSHMAMEFSQSEKTINAVILRPVNRDHQATNYATEDGEGNADDASQLHSPAIDDTNHGSKEHVVRTDDTETFKDFIVYV